MTPQQAGALIRDLESREAYEAAARLRALLACDPSQEELEEGRDARELEALGVLLVGCTRVWPPTPIAPGMGHGGSRRARAGSGSAS